MRLAMFSVRAFVLVSLFAKSPLARRLSYWNSVRSICRGCTRTKVTAVNVDTGVARSSVANQSGNYLITALLPGSYRVTAEAPGSSRSLVS